MQLTPRYDDAPVLRIDGPLPDPAEVLLRQRRRLGDLLSGLTEEQWATQSRCDAWTVRDVVAHLVDADRFWALSVGSALGGEPTRVMASFDPVATPAMLVAGGADAPATKVLARYHAATDALADLFGGLDDDGWDVLAEAPPGHIPVRALALHALWDGWVHERDVALPLGLTPVVDDDEVSCSLLYVAALGPTFMACGGSTRAGTLVVEASEPTSRVVVAVGPEVVASLGGDAPSDAVVVRGPALDLLEGLSLRAPLAAAVDDGDRWILAGLAPVFDQA